LLKVEDNNDFRKFMCEDLAIRCNILHAKLWYGKLLKATKEIPDLNISDVMILELDDIEMCNRLKSDEINQSYSHYFIII
jgi:response regulator RpfG family c-di-GMP phosphodiesterase